MKRRILFISLFALLNVSAQNPFIDGIQSAGRIDFRGDGSESIFNNFKIEFPTETSAIYSYNYHWKEDKGDDFYLFEIKWNWVDITAIKVDKDLFVVQLNTAYRVMESSTYKGRTNAETIVDDKALNADIYFKNVDDAMAAAKWIVTKVQQCGGNAVLVP